MASRSGSGRSFQPWSATRTATSRRWSSPTRAASRAIKARIYIDCTGDDDLAAWAGAEFQKGDEAGDMQPATHCFVLSNVKEEGLKALPGRLFGGAPLSPVHAILASGRYPEITDAHLCHNKIGPGAEGFNSGHLFHVDNTDPASGLQPRARRVRAGRSPTRSAATPTSSICTRPRKRPAKKSTRPSHRFEHYKAGESHGIPYRCLTPKGLRNVLVAGRNISVEGAVHGSIRVMPVCLAMGEAAGDDVHAVDTVLLRARLLAAGAYLPDRQIERTIA